MRVSSALGFPGVSCQFSMKLGVAILLAAGSGFGQVSVIRSGSVEIGPFFGASVGGSGNYRFMGGGNITYAVNKWILPYFEYSYAPIGASEASATFAGTGRSFQLTGSVPVSDIHGGVHIRFPIREKPVVPYVAFGLGAVTYPNSTFTATVATAGETQSVPLTLAGGSNFAVNGGGGLRFYIGQRFGIRTEAKIYRLVGVTTSGLPPGSIALGSTFGKVEAGFFFQLR